MKRILGLDVSTSCTGWSLMTTDASLCELGFTYLGKEKCLYSKGKRLQEVLLTMKEKGVDEVVIEDCLQAFRHGKSSARVLMTLAKFNGIISYICWDIWGKAPTHINPNEARKLAGIKLISKKKGGAPTKDQVFEWVDSRVDYDWPTKILKSGPRKGLEILEPGCKDAADAYVVALAGLIKMNI